MDDSSINPGYFDQESIKKIRSLYHSNKDFSSITLQNFFSGRTFQKCRKELAKLKFIKDKDPLHHSYAIAKLSGVLQTIISHKDLTSFLSLILNKKIKKIEASAYLISWKDYSILHDEAKEKPGIDLIVDCTSGWDERAGGSIIYVDGTGHYHRIPAKENQLIIAERTKPIQRFFQYVNHYSQPKKRLLIMGTIR